MTLSAKDDAIRRHRLTASEAPGLLGYGPGAKTDAARERRIEEAIEKWGRKAAGEKMPMFAPMDAGHRFEGAIVDAYLERVPDLHGEVHCEKSGSIVHPTEPWLCATFDRMLWCGPDIDRIVEAKLVGPEVAKREWVDGLVPEYVCVQVCVQLAVAHAAWKVDRCDVATWRGGNTWAGEFFTLLRDPRTEQDVIRQLHSIYLQKLVPLIPKEAASHA